MIIPSDPRLPTDLAGLVRQLTTLWRNLSTWSRTLGMNKPGNGQVPVWNSTTGQFEPGTLSGTAPPPPTGTGLVHVTGGAQDSASVTIAALSTMLSLSGTNTGDQTSVTGNAGTATKLATARLLDGQSFDGSADIAIVGPAIHAGSNKTTPADTDELGMWESGAAPLRKLTWANLKASIWAIWGALISAGTSKTTPIDADAIALMDSAASNATKKLTWANIKATLKTYFDTLYAGVGAISGMGGIVDVVATYGADPTGVADSLAAFNNARNSGAAVVWVPPGTYKLSAVLTWDDEVGLWGPGSRLVTLKAYGSGFGFVLRPSSSGSKTSLRGFTLDGASNTQVGTLAGMLIQRKAYAEDVVVQNFNGDGAVFAPYDALTTDGTGGTIGNAVFFSLWTDCIFTQNGRDGLRVRMGANANGFINCQFTKNGISTGTGVGFHHLTDGGATYGNFVLGGQASYNCSYGWYFETGTDGTASGLYSEFNGSTDNTNTNGYTNTAIDIYVGDNFSRSDIQVGTLFGASSTHVRAPTSGLNDGLIVKAGGDRVFGSTKSHTPHEVAGPAAPSFATLADAQTFCAALRTALISGGTIS